MTSTCYPKSVYWAIPLNTRSPPLMTSFRKLGGVQIKNEIAHLNA